MENLGIDGKLLLAQLINFGLFFLIFKKYIAKPFSLFLREQIEKEKERQRITEEIKKSEEKMVEKEKEWRGRMRSEEEKIIKEAQKEAEKVKLEIVEEAKREAKIIVDKARDQIEEERRTMNQGIKSKVGELSVIMVNRALNDFLDEESRKKITNYILNKLIKKNETLS